MYLTQKHLHRRTILKGLGLSLSLPLLDAMVPAAAAAPAGKKRFIGIEVPHGAVGCSPQGAARNMWAPIGEGHDFDLSAGSLSPMEPWRDYLTVVSNTDSRMAEAFIPSEVGADHYRSASVFLTQAHPKQTEGSDVHLGISLDQLYAKRFGQETAIPSMQLCIENVDQAGGCGYGYACVYTDTVSWADANTPLPMVRDPRAAFDQLFGAGATSEERALRRREDRSVLDVVTTALGRLSKELGGEDRARLSNFTENVREIERRLHRVEQQNSSAVARELPNAPVGVPDSFDEHVKLMYDLQVLAFAADVTRTFTFKLGRDSSVRVYPESGSMVGFHNSSHYGERLDLQLDFERINRYHVSTVAYLLERLKATPDGDSDLLENSLVVYGSAMADSNLHNHRRIPLFLAGHLGGAVKGNLHIKADDGTPTANVLLTVAHGLGLDDASFGDSTGPLALTTTRATGA